VANEERKTGREGEGEKKREKETDPCSTERTVEEHRGGVKGGGLAVIYL